MVLPCFVCITPRMNTPCLKSPLNDCSPIVARSLSGENALLECSIVRQHVTRIGDAQDACARSLVAYERSLVLFACLENLLAAAALHAERECTFVRIPWRLQSPLAVKHTIYEFALVHRLIGHTLEVALAAGFSQDAHPFVLVAHSFLDLALALQLIGSPLALADGAVRFSQSSLP